MDVCFLTVGPGKEWKPKSTNHSIVQGVSTAASSEVSIVVENHSELQPTPEFLSSKEVTLELLRNLEETHISDSQHVIIPNHLHVPDAEKLGFCFGSFDASFELDMSYNSGPESDKSQPLSESPEAIKETVKEPSPRSRHPLSISPKFHSVFILLQMLSFFHCHVALHTLIHLVVCMDAVGSINEVLFFYFWVFQVGFWSIKLFLLQE